MSLITKVYREKGLSLAGTGEKWPKLVVTPPGPRAREVLRRDESVVSPSYNRRYALVIDSGSGCILRDVDGNEYIDLDVASGCLGVGASNPEVLTALSEQSRRLPAYPSSDLYSEVSVGLAVELAGLFTFRQGKVFLATSGVEGFEAALKLARWYTRNPWFIAFTGSSHGETYGALSLSSAKPVQRRHFTPLMPCVAFAPYPYCFRCPFKLNHPECDYQCISFIEEQMLGKYVASENVAAAVFEPIQREDCVIPPPGYFQRLRKLADRHGFTLIDDERWTGLGRTGKWSALEHWETHAEVLCLGEALAAGLPLGAVIAEGEVMDWEPGSHTSTSGANLMACVSTLKVIEIVKRDRLLMQSTQTGRHIVKRLDELRGKYPILGDVRGKGLMIGVEVLHDPEMKSPGELEAKEILKRCWRRGVVLGLAGSSTIRITPPLNISTEFLDSALNVVEGVVGEVYREKTG